MLIKKESDTRLLRFNLKKFKIEFSPENPGKEITDNNPTMKIDPEAFDHYAEVKPVDFLPDMMAHGPKFFKHVEFPKFKACTGSYFTYIGLAKSVFRMIRWQKSKKNKVAKEKESDLKKLKKDIREYAESLGFICAFTKIDRRYVSDGDDEAFPYGTAMVLGMKVDADLIQTIPNIGLTNPDNPTKRMWDFEIYQKASALILEVGKFIHSKGYRCFPRIPFDGAVKFPPHAVNAGLGNFGLTGLVITPQYGKLQRWGMISVDADIEPDPPQELNVSAFCNNCRLCIKGCPPGAMPMEPFWWRGGYKHRVNDKKCFQNFVKTYGCGICLKVCPFGKLGYEKCTETLPAYYQYNTVEN